MKMFFSILALSLSAQAFSITISELGLNREGGGQISAYVRKAPHGIRVIVSKCNFEDYSHHRSAVIRDKSLASQAEAILDGKAIIASDLSPVAPLTQTGTWFKLNYKLDMSQFTFPNGYTPTDIKTIEVEKPIIILDNAVSDVLDQLEKEARKLCD